MPGVNNGQQENEANPDELRVVSGNGKMIHGEDDKAYKKQDHEPPVINGNIGNG
jgi:hypothetical protein